MRKINELRLAISRSFNAPKVGNQIDVLDALGKLFEDDRYEDNAVLIERKVRKSEFGSP